MRDEPMNMNEHETVLALLPWEANGTLAGDQRPRVAAHLAHCALCRGELALLERSFAIASRAPRVEAATIDAGWRRMTSRLEQDDARRHAKAEPLGWHHALAQALGWLRPTSGWGLAGSAAAVAAVVAMVVGYPLLSSSERDAAPYRVLTSAPNGGAAETALLLRVKFKGNTSPALLTQWLVDARTATTLRRESASQYLVELPPPADFQAMNRVFEQLSRRAEVEDVQIVVPGK
jgi:hypothetical protein